MNEFRSLFKSPAGLILALLVAVMAGCGSGGLDPLLGTPQVGVEPGPGPSPEPEPEPAPTVTRPTVSIVTPAQGTTSVPNNTQVSATFSKEMNPATISAQTFTVVDNALGRPVPGTVTYSASARTAIFTPAEPQTFADNTQFTATLGGSITDLGGNALVDNYVWTFMTAALADTTRPVVVLAAPAPGATAVPNNAGITATFSEDMDASTLSAASFTLRDTTVGTRVEGTVTYSATARTATFTPSAGALAHNSSFTAAIAPSATDLAGNPLAGDTGPLPGAGGFVWSFTTAAAPDLTAPTVSGVGPANDTPEVCLTKKITATFSEPMDPATINESTFRVADVNGTVVPGTVTYDPERRMASFSPDSIVRPFVLPMSIEPKEFVGPGGFMPGIAYIVTIVSGDAGVRDAAGNPLAADETWRFTTGFEVCSTVADLGTARSFAALAGAGVMNRTVGAFIIGNVGATADCTSISGLHDTQKSYSETEASGTVNGTIFCGPSAPGSVEAEAIATRAANDARAAYEELVAKPAGSDPGAGELGGQVLPPGVYTAAGGAFRITTGDLVLDAQGDPNATWVFQSAEGLTVGLPGGSQRLVVLLNGARRNNVFWQVGRTVTIAGGSRMEGTIIARGAITLSGPSPQPLTIFQGRAISLDGSVTLYDTYVYNFGSAG